MQDNKQFKGLFTSPPSKREQPGWGNKSSYNFERLAI